MFDLATELHIVLFTAPHIAVLYRLGLSPMLYIIKRPHWFCPKGG